MPSSCRFVFHFGQGQQNDIPPAYDPVRWLPAKQALADRTYDADSLHDIILEAVNRPFRRDGIARISVAYKQR
ncbi:UNVERIFIED_ORG: hypothetical protein GGE53_002481 [Rhizobium etli]